MVNSSFDILLQDYALLLKSVDRWFSESAAAAGDAVQCGTGCSSCCRGLFDITLLDAYFLRQGFDRLAHTIQNTVRSRVATQMESLRSAWPDMSPPYIINFLPEGDWDLLMPEEDSTPCPLLGEDGLCLVYEYRPMTCRLHGIPLIDISGEFFHDEWCSCNFKNEDPLSREEIRWEFRKCFQEELSIFREFTNILLNQRINELDTLLPLAVLIDFHGFDWEGWWGKCSENLKNGGFPENHSSRLLRD
jgi:Fe-S-cluster containining protein